MKEGHHRWEVKANWRGGLDCIARKTLLQGNSVELSGITLLPAIIRRLMKGQTCAMNPKSLTVAKEKGNKACSRRAGNRISLLEN
jgi:hypothetical protein